MNIEQLAQVLAVLVMVLGTIALWLAGGEV